MLWIKSLHIVFVTAWFAGLFYLPRIFVNLAQQPQDGPVYPVLLGMARRLLRFTTMLAIPAIAFGLVLMLYYRIGLANGWLHAKLLFVLLIIGYHHACFRIYTKFVQGRNQRDHVFYRWFNEIPVLLLLAVVILVVTKPF